MYSCMESLKFVDENNVFSLSKIVFLLGSNSWKHVIKIWAYPDFSTNISMTSGLSIQSFCSPSTVQEASQNPFGNYGDSAGWRSLSIKSDRGHVVRMQGVVADGKQGRSNLSSQRLRSRETLLVKNILSIEDIGKSIQQTDECFS